MVQHVARMPSQSGVIGVARPHPVSSARAARTQQLLEGAIVPIRGCRSVCGVLRRHPGRHQRQHLGQETSGANQQMRATPPVGPRV